MCFVLTMSCSMLKKMYLSFVPKMKLFIRPLFLINLQQNGVVERKHKHILDIARTIMIHMSVLKYLWSDDVLSACHLINRMPSSVLDKKNLHFLVSFLTKHISP